SSPESPAIGLAARGRHHQQRALAVSIAAIEPMLSEIEYAGHLTTGSPSCLHQVSIDNAVLSIPVRWGSHRSGVRWGCPGQFSCAISCAEANGRPGLRLGRFGLAIARRSLGLQLPQKL